jgi:hypothetical protein
MIDSRTPDERVTEDGQFLHSFYKVHVDEDGSVCLGDEITQFISGAKAMPKSYLRCILQDYDLLDTQYFSVVGKIKLVLPKAAARARSLPIEDADNG